ncbi:PREDICTED: anthocyanidin 3-O-glucosyltransferase 2-like [Ipomoea nil]|uniref:anthocyanidin 3-O-glucosyltransferase 2-like n=1 Tax=Ipomoea nil TaxID=35883 RepID=UPI000900D196|nr:PREDICTED: anthocyanidin 3-O-glucosyltransferase 2-like [Ipomoea nil]
MEDSIELVFVPTPSMGHLVSAVGTAKLLLQRQPQLSITVLIVKMPLFPGSNINSFIDSLIADEKDMNPRLKLILLPEDLDALKGNTEKFSIFHAFLDSQKAKVRDYCLNEFQKSPAVSGRRRLAGFVADIFCTDKIMDVAEEFGVPTYVFYALGAAMLGLLLHFRCLKDDHGIDYASEFKDSDPDLNIPAYFKPFPVKLLPNLPFFDLCTRLREAKGVITNTFLELEPHAIQSLSNDKRFPPVYPLGPVLNLNRHPKNNRESEGKQIFQWLDDQPASSVVFLCFGSGGAFSEPQVKEIAYALERSGQRFLWALRKPPSPGSVLPTEYSNLDEVMPEGFLERTKSIGKVIGWAPQTAVLAHPAVGGFVSHCGWNSTLEGIWFGIPIATWPMSVDQQGNAFQLVREIGTAVDIKMDYRVDSRDPNNKIPIIPEIVNAKEIEIGITSLMDRSTPNSIRTKAKEFKEKSRKALEDGGSSINFVERFFENVTNNLK